MRRFWIAAITAAAIVALGTPGAQAVMTRNDLGCSGDATLTGKKVSAGDPSPASASANTGSTRVTVPRAGTARWRGSGGAKGRTYSGNISLDLGSLPIFGEVKVGLYRWGKPDQAVTTDRGTVKLPEGFKKVPPGIYKVSGKHVDNAGACEGWVEIEFLGGAPAGFPAGSIAWILTVLGAFGLFMSGRRRRGSGTPSPGTGEKDPDDIEGAPTS